MTIVSGNVEYSTPRPFEATSAKVSITFSVDPGEDAEAVATHAGDMARRHAMRMLGRQDVGPIVTADTPVAGGTTRSRSRTAAAPASLPATSGPTAPTHASPSEEFKPTVTVDEKGVHEVKLTPDAPIDDPVPDFSASVPAASVEITDVDLGTAMNKKAQALAAAGKPVNAAFGALAKEFGLAVPTDYRKLTQEQRPAFLEKLDVLGTDPA